MRNSFVFMELETYKSATTLITQYIFFRLSGNKIGFRLSGNKIYLFRLSVNEILFFRLTGNNFFGYAIHKNISHYKGTKNFSSVQ